MNPTISTELEHIPPRLIRGLCKMGVATDHAEDIVQDALCYLLSTGRLESFTPQGPQGMATLFTFIFRKCLYILCSYTARQRVINEGARTLSILHDGHVGHNGWEARALLEHLAPKDRTLLIERYGLGYSMREMSERWGVNRFTIRRWLKVAEERLGKYV